MDKATIYYILQHDVKVNWNYINKKLVQILVGDKLILK